MDRPVIEFIRPTSLSYARMKAILFSPFDAGKWFVLGFTAWLAGLLDGGGSSGGGGGDDFGDEDLGEESFQEFYEESKEWVMENWEWIVGIGSVVFLVILAICIALLWVSSRGKFLFLDNVVHNRALVVEPWKRFRYVANSLFWWRLGFGIVSAIVLLGILGVAAVYVIGRIEAEAWSTEATLITILLGGLFVAGLVLVGYISTLLEDFVIPIMYQRSLAATAAWRVFLDLHGQRWGTFFLYFLWVMLLGLATGLLVLAFGMATCCIGFLVLAIPYLGTVLLLPVLVVFRALGPEFLRQFGREWDILSPGDGVPMT